MDGVLNNGQCCHLLDTYSSRIECLCSHYTHVQWDQSRSQSCITSLVTTATATTPKAVIVAFLPIWLYKHPNFMEIAWFTLLVFTKWLVQSTFLYIHHQPVTTLRRFFCDKHNITLPGSQPQLYRNVGLLKPQGSVLFVNRCDTNPH